MTEKTRTKGTTMMYKILHRKRKIEQTNSNKNRAWTPEGISVLAAQVNPSWYC